jgi:hypothetical protein
VSAIVKPGGMFTFSQHATKPFYSWGDLLGAEFVTAATNESMAKATIDVWWDSKKYWFRGKDGYASHELRSFVLYLKTDCNMSAKPDPNGKSVIDEAVRHVEREQRVDAAVPFVFRPPGIVDFQGQKILNTYCRRAIQPCTGTQKWGPHGEFSFSAAMFDNLFRFNNGHQLPWFLAHWKWLYESALYEMPRPQMNFTLCGDPGKGKTLANREYVGMSVGGYADASDYLMKGAVFNSHLFCVGHWCVDDDTMTIDHDHLQRMQSMFKKMSSNQQHEHNKKFEVSGMLEWMGNTGVSINADFRSTRIISAMDAGSLSKMCLYRCVSDEDSQFTFPSYVEMKKILIAERPALLRWLVDWTPPDYVIRSRDRYGFMAYQEPTLLEQTQQTSTVAPFRETLLEALIHFFAEHKDRAEWTGTVTQLVRLMDGQGSKIRVELVNRYLEQIQREGTIKCENRTGNWNTRLWIFRRADFDINKPVVAPLVPVGDNAHFAAK